MIKINIKNYFTKLELILWTLSIAIIVIAFIIWDRINYLNLIASLIGVTSLIFTAKGNPIGQLLILVFSMLYGIISYSFKYYGEMITYLGMTSPMALFSFISWIKHPASANKIEVSINHLKVKEYLGMLLLTALITFGFYFILNALATANIVFSTISVATSFLAVYLTFRRSQYYALAYALNDIVLIILWILAAKSNISFLSITICFVVFFLNDIYGFINWSRIKQKQENKRGINEN